jgi:hypothetical protein
VITIDLSTPEKASAFIERTGSKRGRQLANSLGSHGKHSTLLANNISGYAHNKRAIKYCTTESGVKIYERCCELGLVLMQRCQAFSQIRLLK